MKISCFTFLRNAALFGYPFIESIKSALPLCDEFIVNIGDSIDDTLAQVQAINDPKIRIIQSQWNEKMRIKGYVYGQQKSIAHFNCNGDWAFYLEADEVLHEDDLPKIKAAMEKHLHNDQVEALAFEYLHFYGNHNTYAWGPRWYRYAPRIIKNTVRAYSPDGLYFVVLGAGQSGHKKGRYPYAALTNATIYHYGWVRSEQQMNARNQNVGKYWEHPAAKINYAAIDPITLKLFTGSHPSIMQDWLPKNNPGIFQTDPQHQLTRREKRHRLSMKLEQWFGIDLRKTHFKWVK